MPVTILAQAFSQHGLFVNRPARVASASAAPASAAASAASWSIMAKTGEREKKLQRLNQFRRSMPHVSASALSQFLQGIVDEGMPELRTRNQMHETTQRLMDEVTPHGPLLVEIKLRMLDGSEHTEFAVNPFVVMYHAYKEGGVFQNLMDETVARENVSAENPFRLCVYADEVVPGKELSHNNKRKQWAMYWSFGQLLPVSHLEETWIPI